MEHLLKNPVYHGLASGDQHLSLGTEKVKFFDENVSPFAGIEDGYEKGFDELHQMLTPGRNILHATPENIELPKGWQLLQKVQGVQMMFDTTFGLPVPGHLNIVPLHHGHIAQMVALATLTKPGPFGTRTIDFGHYFGIFDKEHLVAMTGQRLHVHQFTEVSAVCTHPDHLGKGYGAALVQQEVQLILQQGQTPFLHVRSDNHRAITLYERLGFKICGNMNFYFMKRVGNP